ncbi:hypothetical protein PAHAL_1G350700 [Panicum hallii]|jgi:hypothetical protein|uniref:Uncharacterized protein n=1 Tax=Panicum hallii TaxID=206008 RepID=A0A2T8KX98_9POAL|nr:hypothetical protein PAHAL_1G350700 [Panicum hallii]
MLLFGPVCRLARPAPSPAGPWLPRPAPRPEDEVDPATLRGSGAGASASAGGNSIAAQISAAAKKPAPEHGVTFLGSLQRVTRVLWCFLHALDVLVYSSPGRKEASKTKTKFDFGSDN